MSAGPSTVTILDSTTIRNDGAKSSPCSPTCHGPGGPRQSTLCSRDLRNTRSTPSSKMVFKAM